MGDRGQVIIEDTGIVLYTHWRATELPDDVFRSLSLRERWDDPEYLARIIFCHMTQSRCSTETNGYGIGTMPHSDAWQNIYINCENKTININEKKQPFESFILTPNALRSTAD